jgi:hypothetical protein
MLTLSRMGRVESFLKFKDWPVRNGRRFGRWTPIVWKLGAYAGTVVAKLRVLAPYAVIVFVVPGGSLMALLLWLHRRQWKVPVFPGR